MASATASTKFSSPLASPHSRSSTSPPHRVYSRPSTAPPPIRSRHSSPSLKVSSRPASVSTSLFGYTSTIRTISPQIANFRPATRDIVRAIAPHVLDERKTRRRSSSRIGSPSWPGKPYHSHHHDRSFGPHTHSYPYHSRNPWSSETGFVQHRAEKKKLKSSPLRIAAVIRWDDNESIYLQQPSCNERSVTADSNTEGPQSISQMTGPPPGLDPPLSSPLFTPSQTLNSSDASTISSSSDKSSAISLSSTEDEDRAGHEARIPKRTRAFRLESSKLFRRIVIKFRPNNNRLVRS